jgi:hypothetical protein
MERFKRQAAQISAAPALSSESRLRNAQRVGVGSGRHAMPYSLMREVLLTYLSPILVDSVLQRALTARRLTPETLTSTELLELASDIMVGLRLFVNEERLPKLMLDLADVLEGT